MNEEIKEIYQEIYDSWESGGLVLTDGEVKEIRKVLKIDIDNQEESK